jgi:hypothetical protein
MTSEGFIFNEAPEWVLSHDRPSEIIFHEDERLSIKRCVAVCRVCLFLCNVRYHLWSNVLGTQMTYFLEFHLLLDGKFPQMYLLLMAPV